MEINSLLYSVSADWKCTVLVRIHLIPPLINTKASRFVGQCLRIEMNRNNSLNICLLNKDLNVDSSLSIISFFFSSILALDEEKYIVFMIS